MFKYAVLALMTVLAGCASSATNTSSTIAPAADWRYPTIWEEGGASAVIRNLGTGACALLDIPDFDDELEVAMLPRRRLPPPEQRDQVDRPPRILIERFAAVLDVPADKDAPAERVAIIVPRHFSSDFYSIPRKILFVVNARAFVSDLQFAPEPSVLHDWLYAIGVDGDEEDRAFADRVMLASMTRERVTKEARSLAHRAVVKGGEAGHGNPEEMRFFHPHEAELVDRLDLTDDERSEIRQLSFCRRPIA